MVISLLCLIVCEMEYVNCESETLRKFDEKREVFWQPARLGEIGRAHRAARHGKTARGPCLGPEAQHEHGSGTARPARWPVQGRRHAGTARWPSILTINLLSAYLYSS